MKRLFDLSQATTVKMVLVVVALYGFIAAVTYLVWS